MGYKPGGISERPELDMRGMRDPGKPNEELANLQADVLRTKSAVEDTVANGIMKIRTEISFLLNTFKLSKDQEEYYLQLLKVTES